jgi:hypothetical protein
LGRFIADPRLCAFRGIAAGAPRFPVQFEEVDQIVLTLRSDSASVRFPLHRSDPCVACARICAILGQPIWIFVHAISVAHIGHAGSPQAMVLRRPWVATAMKPAMWTTSMESCGSIRRGRRTSSADCGRRS